MTRQAADWSALAAVIAVAGWALGRMGIPSPFLFAALVTGLAAALRRPRRFDLPGGAFPAAQAVCGVVLGAYLHSPALSAVAAAWPAVLAVSAGTLAVCLVAGAVLARATGLDAVTAALGMVAGGASGIVAMAGDLGGDDRLVAFMQYARVLVVVLVTPLLAGLLFGSASGPAIPPAGEALLAGPADWAVALGIAGAGVALGRAVRLPAATLLGPMLLAAVLTLSDALGSFTVPPLLREAAFIAIGLEVGLRFTTATVREAGRLLLPVLAAIAGLIVACLGLAVVLHLGAGVTLEDAYLATTPGGLYAVLAVAVGAQADTTFILAVQGLRLLIMVLLAPLLVRVLVAGGPARSRA